MPEDLALALLIAVFALPILIGAAYEIWRKRRDRSLQHPGRRMAGAGLGVMNEVFHPAANEHSIVVEESKEAIAPKPSPEDK
jgi:hypothetical protein